MCVWQVVKVAPAHAQTKEGGSALTARRLQFGGGDGGGVRGGGENPTLLKEEAFSARASVIITTLFSTLGDLGVVVVVV